VAEGEPDTYDAGAQTQQLNEQSLREKNRLLALSADVGRSLTTKHTLPDMLRGCACALVEHLDAAFARIWTLNPQEEMLVLRASAGMYTHLDGPHGEIPVGEYKIGLIAQERQPHLTNSVIGDPRVSNQSWAIREGMVAFAGYPLIVEEQVVGVMAMFARRALNAEVLLALGTIADQIAVGIDRKRSEEALRASEGRYRAAIAHAAVGVTLADLFDRCLETNAAFCEIVGYSEEELLHKDFQSLTFPEDREESIARMEHLRSGSIPHFVMEKRYVRKDGRIVWVQNSVALVRGAHGEPESTIALTEDISERKEAAARQRRLLRDVLASVTEGRLILCQSADDLPPLRTPFGSPIALSASGGLSELRQAARDAAREAGHSENRTADLIIAVSEAGMNTIVHARSGEAQISIGDGIVQVHIEDHGAGITLENIPNAALKKGFTTAGTLGQGMKMMLETVDRIYLLTGETGTTIVIEQERAL
jgi:PAS domain S-box-containing protein